MKFKSFVIDWHKNIIDLIDRENRPAMKKYLRAQKINADRCDDACIRQWNLSTLKTRKMSEIEKINDIRMFSPL